ncbi:hypothetical protein Tco_0917087 [Tanacetum coccineum]
MTRRDGWAEVNKRVTTTTLDKAAASNSTVYQELTNTAAEHTSCADKEQERNKVDQRAEELGQPVDELERADALTLNVEPQTAPVVGQQLQLLHMLKQTLRGNDARTNELIHVRSYYPLPITHTKCNQRDG